MCCLPAHIPCPEETKEGEIVENYTKYALKSTEELEALLEGKDHLFVVACNKCYKAFDTTQEPELREFVKLAEQMGKTVVGTAKADFLCNETKAVKGLGNIIPENAKHVMVIACGLGVQTVAARVWWASLPNLQRALWFPPAPTLWTHSWQKWNARSWPARSISKHRPCLILKNSSSSWKRPSSLASRCSWV